MEKEEPSFKFPSNWVSYLSKSTATIAEFNNSGTLLAVGCKMGIILIMDMLTSRIVKCLSYFPDLEISDWIFHGFEDFEEFDLLYLLKNLKASKLTPTETKSGAKSKQSNIKLKDYTANIESLQFSSDSKRLLVAYKSKGGPRIEDSENKSSSETTKTKNTVGSKILEWDIFKGEVLHEYDHEYRASQVQYLQNQENVLIVSGALPYIVTDFEKKECIINEIEYENKIEKIYEKDERWVVKSLDSKAKRSFVVFNKDYNMLAVIESKDPSQRDTKSYALPLTKEKYEITHDELRLIIESKERVDSQQDMDVDLQEDVFQNFKQFFADKQFTVKAYACMNSEVTNLVVYQHNSLIIANCFDKVLRLYDASDETLSYISTEAEMKLKPFREFTDIVLKRKFAGGMFYRVPEDKDLYLLTGIEKAGELIAYSVKLGSQYARVGNWKEGCEYMAYFYNDMK